MTSEQERLDAELRSYYGHETDEQTRLLGRSVGGQVEYLRVRRILEGRLVPGSRVLDVGGATGVHARWLAEAGHDVVMIDPVPEQVERAAQVGTFEARVGDARRLDLPDESFDAVLMFGPLYHLVAPSERRKALDEARRVLRPDGWLFAQGLSRLSAFCEQYAGQPASPMVPSLRILTTGTWINPGAGFPGGHFHTADELAAEVAAAGFVEAEVLGLDGPMLGSTEWFGADQLLLEAQLAVLERMDELAVERGVGASRLADLSPHVMAIARRD